MTNTALAKYAHHNLVRKDMSSPLSRQNKAKTLLH